jgi:DNA-binding CsgD family transcriptional regulator
MPRLAEAEAGPTSAAVRLAEALRDLLASLLPDVLSPVQPATPDRVPLVEVRSVPREGSMAGVSMHVRLTAREREIVGHIAQGLGTAEMAARMYLGERTVKNYVARALAKLNATNRAHGVAIAFRMGFIDPTIDELLGVDCPETERSPT